MVHLEHELRLVYLADLNGVSEPRWRLIHVYLLPQTTGELLKSLRKRVPEGQFLNARDKQLPRQADDR